MTDAAKLQGFQINDIFNQKVKSTKTISNLQFYQYEINFSIDVKYFMEMVLQYLSKGASGETREWEY